MVLLFLVYGVGVFAYVLAGEKVKMQEVKKYYLKGKEFLRQGDYGKANEEFKKAQLLLRKSISAGRKKLIIRRREGELLVRRAQSLAQEGNYKEAIKIYLQALTFFPNNVDLNYNLAVQYLKAGEWQRAKERLERVIELDPQDKDAYYNLGILYEKFLKEKEKAKQCYRKFIELSSPAEAEIVKRWLYELKKGEN